MSHLYEPNSCRDCKDVTLISVNERHYAEKHGDGRKLFRCEECDYSSNKKADVVRHKSSRHKSEDTRQVSLGLKEPNEPSTSKPRSPPRVQRPDWPTLQTIVGSPHSATEFQQENHLDEAIEQRDTPPTPVVTPLKRSLSQPNDGDQTRKVLKKAIEDANRPMVGNNDDETTKGEDFNGGTPGWEDLRNCREILKTTNPSAKRTFSYFVNNFFYSIYRREHSIYMVS
ncbi:hypothetical protein BSL78_24119 [Apostichopus japonicus]|uniref:C2H2-type domain-containing protein n=1 Tax=Stichopus japonicus TaxID=307972 RepID=A0A2G8JTJ3_STIJA|nr:hypothetical protein BSL78_24119 [Apostichopus japonicus]